MSQLNKLYRNFIILQEDERGYSISNDKTLSGYSKIEAKGEKCKISFYAQNLRSDSDDYCVLAVCSKKDTKQLVNLGKLTISDGGKAEVVKEYFLDDVGGIGLSFDKVTGAAIAKMRNNIPLIVMCGFVNGEQPTDNWKNYKVVKASNDKLREKIEYIKKDDKKRDRRKDEKNKESKEENKNKKNECNEEEMKMKKMHEEEMKMKKMHEEEMKMKKMHEEEMKMKKMHEEEMKMKKMHEEEMKMKKMHEEEIKMKQMHEEEMKMKQMHEEEMKMKKMHEEEMKMKQMHEKEMNMNQCVEKEMKMKYMHEKEKDYCNEDEDKMKHMHKKEKDYCDEYKMKYMHEKEKDYCNEDKMKHMHEKKNYCNEDNMEHMHEKKNITCKMNDSIFIEDLVEEKKYDKNRFSENINDKNPFDENIYDKNPFGENIYDKNRFGENINDKNSFGENIYDKNRFGENINDKNSFGENIYGKNRFGENINDKNSFGENIYGKNRYGENINDKNSFSENIYSKNPFGDYETRTDFSRKHNKFDEYESKIEELSGNFKIRGSVGEYFEGIASGFEVLPNEYREIKNCKWYRVPIKDLDELCNMNNYNRYTVAYYPMLNYYPYIRKHGYFNLGYKCDREGNLKYIVYGIPGNRNLDEQPYEGKTGFVTWINKENRDSMGCWLMFYDFRNSTVVVPME